LSSAVVGRRTEDASGPQVSLETSMMMIDLYPFYLLYCHL